MKQILVKPWGIAMVDDADYEELNKFNWFQTAFEEGRATKGE